MRGQGIVGLHNQVLLYIKRTASLNVMLKKKKKLDKRDRLCVSDFIYISEDRQPTAGSRIHVPFSVKSTVRFSSPSFGKKNIYTMLLFLSLSAETLLGRGKKNPALGL